MCIMVPFAAGVTDLARAACGAGAVPAGAAARAPARGACRELARAGRAGAAARAAATAAARAATAAAAVGAAPRPRAAAAVRRGPRTPAIAGGAADAAAIALADGAEENEAQDLRWRVTLQGAGARKGGAWVGKCGCGKGGSR